MPYNDAYEFTGLTIEHDPNEPMGRRRPRWVLWSLARAALWRLLHLMSSAVATPRQAWPRSA